MSDYTYAGRVHIKGKQEWVRLTLISAAMGGINLYLTSTPAQNRLTDSSLHDSAWAAEQIYFMNYMISIGIPKSTISLVWLAGPITGLVGQPLFGAMSDSCKSSWGMIFHSNLGGA